MQVYFSITQPHAKTKKFKLSEGEYVILGRSKEKCHVPLSDEMMSTTHCKVSLSNKCIHIEDMNSKNGIYLNGLRIIKQRIYLEDKVKIGDSFLYIQQDRLNEEEISYLKYQGTSTRIKQTGYTLELDKKVANKIDSINITSPSKKALKSNYEQVRRKSYSKHRHSKKQPKTPVQDTVMDYLALSIDSAFSIIVFIFGLFMYKILYPEIYLKIATNRSLFQTLFHDEMAMWTFITFIISVSFFSINRNAKSGTIGEKILKIN